MNRGGTFVSIAALLALASCGGEQGRLTIRSMPSALAQGEKPVPFRIAEARGQFALGNVALALESFRKALREDPRSVDAALGIAGCYVKMQRFDLSQRYYEAALAIEPRNLAALTQLAASLDVQGKAEQAALVRAELQARAMPVPNLDSAELSGSLLAAGSASLPGTQQPADIQIGAFEEPAEPPPAAEVRSVMAAVGAATASVTMKLPAPDRAAPLASHDREHAGEGPRLERTSLGEVALITGSGPTWTSETVSRSARSTTIRFVPLPRPETRQAAVRLLNAARVHRLAARTREFLNHKGWQRISVGDAPAVRRRSLILYPADQRATAERLAAQFGFALAANSRIHRVTIYLGRDAPRHPNAGAQG